MRLARALVGECRSWLFGRWDRLDLDDVARPWSSSLRAAGRHWRWIGEAAARGLRQIRRNWGGSYRGGLIGRGSAIGRWAWRQRGRRGGAGRRRGTPGGILHGDSPPGEG